MDAHLSQIVFVLYQPQDVVNVASVIRVMSNFGLPHLRLVEPAAFDAYRIAGIAHHTDEIIAAVRRFPTLAEALSDCGLVLATSGKPRAGGRQLLAPRQAAPLMLETGRLDPAKKVAVLFGREQDGLPNEALAQAHGVVTIPTHPQNMSLNLAQAALVIAYELWMAHAGETAAPAPLAAAPNLAGAADREAMFQAVRELLLALYPTTTEARLSAATERLRNLLMRATPRTEEARALANLFRHAARALRDRGERT